MEFLEPKEENCQQNQEPQKNQDNEQNQQNQELQKNQDNEQNQQNQEQQRIITTTTEEITGTTEEVSTSEHSNRKPSSAALMDLIAKIDLERIDITDLIVVVALSVGFIYSIYMKMMELAMSIGSGLLGYIGGVSKREEGNAVRKKETTTTVRN